MSSARRARPPALAVLVLGAALVICGLASPGRGEEPGDDRSFELLRYECRTTTDRRELTLFGNGTIRLREGLGEKSEMKLDEMSATELSSYLAELRRIVAEADPEPSILSEPIAGEWTPDCLVVVALPDGPKRQWRFSALDAPPLAVSQIVHLADNLAGWTLPLVPTEHLPASYEPVGGDVLRTAEGYRYRVARLTADGKGVELDGLDQPLHLIVGVDDLPEVFVAVVERARRF